MRKGLDYVKEMVRLPFMSKFAGLFVDASGAVVTDFSASAVLGRDFCRAAVRALTNSGTLISSHFSRASTSGHTTGCSTTLFRFSALKCAGITDPSYDTFPSSHFFTNDSRTDWRSGSSPTRADHVDSMS